MRPVTAYRYATNAIYDYLRGDYRAINRPKMLRALWKLMSEHKSYISDYSEESLAYDKDGYNDNYTLSYISDRIGAPHRIMYVYHGIIYGHFNGIEIK